MQKIKVADLRPGQRFDKPVYVDSANILVDVGVPIKKSDIERLQKWGIVEVETDGSPMADAAPESEESVPNITYDPKLRRHYHIIHDRLQQISNQKDAFRGIYREGVETVEYVFNSVVAGRPFENNLVREVINKFVDAVMETEGILLNIKAVDTQGHYLYHQAVMTALFSIILGQTIDYSRPRLMELGIGAILADIGMMQVPAHIREKNGKLTDDEFTQIRKHPLLGYKILLQHAKLKNSMAVIALEHQEYYDGSGYPRGLKGNDIDEFSRIVAIADSYAAQTTKRAYRSEKSYYDALKTALSVDFQKFDPILLRKFLSRVSVYPIGSLVELDNKEIALVIFANREKPLRPILKIIRDEEGRKPAKGRYLDLMKESSQYIVKALSPSEAGIEIIDEY